jgi:hypothetical protein
MSSRRKFFENFAAANRFDPLIPRNWYIQSRAKIKEYKVSFSLLLFLHTYVNIKKRELGTFCIITRVYLGRFSNCFRRSDWTSKLCGQVSIFYIFLLFFFPPSPSYCYFAISSPHYIFLFSVMVFPQCQTKILHKICAGS